MRLLRRAAALITSLAVVYVGVTFGQIAWESRRDDARPAQAIVVFGAAQYNGRPSAVLAARLDHALDLWRHKLAPVIVVTGGKVTGDRFTEAKVSADYLLARGVPDAQVLREVSGHSSWQSLAAAAAFLNERQITEVVLVSDPFHSYRIRAMARELGLDGSVSPTRTSPIAGAGQLPYLARETAAVAVGRVVGFRRQANIDEVVRGRV